MDRRSTIDWLEFRDVISDIPSSIGREDKWMNIYNQYIDRIEQICRIAFLVGPRQLEEVSQEPSADLHDYCKRFGPRIWLESNRLGTAFKREAGIHECRLTDELGNTALRINRHGHWQNLHSKENIRVEVSKSSIRQAMRKLRKGLVITFDYVRSSEWPREELGTNVLREEKAEKNYTYKLSSFLESDDDHFCTTSIIYGKFWLKDECVF